MKTCTKCGEEKALDQYGKRGDGLFAYCKVCRARIRKNWSNGRVGSEAIKRAHYKQRYGLTLEQYEEMRRSQKGLCAICRQGPASDVDHCHVTGRVRGLLCGTCNRGLGMFDDDPGVLQAAIDYLEL